MTKMKFKRSAMALAVAGAIGIAAPAVQAVNLAEDGLGEVLLFPYYGVRNGYDTYLNITNTSADTVAVKLRFREAHNSRDVRDFNIILSPYDVWVGAVTLSQGGTGARVQTTDKTCTQPELPVIDSATGLRGVDFTNIDYTGQSEDGGPTDLDRTKEGHVEVIEMGVSPAGNEKIEPIDSPKKDGSLAYYAKHENGVPHDCAKVVELFEQKLPTVQAEFKEPRNNLKGTSTLIKVDAGKAAPVEAVTLANFYNPSASEIDDGNNDDLIFTARDSKPHLGMALPAVSEIRADVNLDPNTPAGVERTILSEWEDNTADAVSAVLMRASVMNQFSVVAGIKAETDIVLTFPTKYFYVDTRETSADAGTGLPPFAKTFQKPLNAQGNPDTAKWGALGTSCDEVVLRIHDREEFSPASSSDFSPPPVGGRNEVCKEVNVLTFNGKNALGSAVSKNIALPTGVESGWIDVDLTRDEGGKGWSRMDDSLDKNPNGHGDRYFGLPVIGFAYTSLENGVVGDNTLNYGQAWNSAYRRQVSGQ